MAYQPNSNSVVAFQSQPSSLLVGASIIGLTPVNVTNLSISPSVISYQAAGSVMAVSGSFSAGNTSVNAYQGGPWSVTALQGTNPWNVNMPSASVIAYQPAGSILLTQMISSVNAVISDGAQTLDLYEENQVDASVIGIAMMWKSNLTTSILSAVTTATPLPVQGSVAVLQGTNPWQVNLSSPSILIITPAGSVQAVRTDNASVIAVLSLSSVATLQGTNPWIVQAIGSIAVQEPGGFRLTSVMNTIPSSMMVGASVFGTVPVTQVTSPWIINQPSPSIVATQIAGSVMAVNMPSPSYLSIQPGGSVMNVNVSGSVSAFVGNNIGSIVGTYQEDQAATTSDKGLFTLHVRNDTMSSVTNADGDYSALTVGPAGEVIIANSPITKWVSGATSVMSGPSVQVIAAPGASIFTYITGIYLTNESSIATRVTITQGKGAVPASMITWFVVPAGGGSNAPYNNPLRVLDNNQISASISTVASVYVTITGFTAKT